MEKTQADKILEEWESHESPDIRCQEWSTLLDYAIEIGDEFIDWNKDITYVRFKDDSILCWDCFFIRPGSEDELSALP